MAEAKKKCRQYSIDYLKFGFIPSLSDKHLPMCLLCNKVLSNDAMKPSKLEDHLRRLHPDKTGKDLTYFKTLKEKLQKRITLDTMFASTSKTDDDGLLASYNISLLIAKSGKPHTIGEQLILPAVEEVLKTVLHKPAYDILKKIPLSDNTVQRRIDEMSHDVESFLCNYLKTNHFSLQVDESTLPGNEVLLMAYVRFVMDQEIHQELLFAKTLTTDTKGESIFNVLKDYFMEKAIPLTNIISVAADGAPAMFGRYCGFISYLKQNVPGIFAIHCVIHRQHLVAKNLSARLHQSLQFVITAVNKIRSNALNSRLFEQLCEENDEDFHRLLLHTEVRWLSKGLCLKRFFSLFEPILEFLDDKAPILKENLIKWKPDIAYLTDLFGKFNEVNLQLQGDSLNLIKTKSIISAFLARINLFKQNIGRREFSQFHNLSLTNVQDDDILAYVQHLNALHSDFKTRFDDVLTMEIPHWVIDPYGAIEESDIALQEELIEISTNEELKVQFKKGYQQFWLQKNVAVTYPALWSIARKFLIAFPSSYLVERGFSAVTNLLTKQRNRLQITERGDLRLYLSHLTPNIKQLLSEHQVHPSH
ncbi:SCAN domain-containing protein 3-like [Emydura macquarii macquarii]|uniref:SCAN domain-containing protein 3-like n=1 Tax=Emydura macquarii macquarii TaxID=1129001 RepID=UPI003529EA5D